MTDLERYLLEEWIEDYRTGRVARREILRRLALWTGSAVLGARLAHQLGVAASVDDVAEAASEPASRPLQAFAPVVAPDDPRVGTEMVSFPDGHVTVAGYLARPRSVPRAPGLVVIHENRGLVDHIKDVARRFAVAGYVALAPDLVSPHGGTDRYSDPAEVTALLGRTPPDQLVSMLNAAVRWLAARPEVFPDRLGAVGFCFGGGLAWRLATANPQLRAVVPFYGPNPPLGDVPKIRAAILALYGALDERIDAGIPAIRRALEDAGVVHDIVVYPGADHAFFNDTGPRYNPQAAADAWARTLQWLGRYL